MSTTALVFYGQVRDVEHTYPYWNKNVIKPLGIDDIFIHTYNDQTEKMAMFTSLFSPKGIFLSNPDDVKNREQWIPVVSRKRYCVQNTFNVQSMYFSMYTAMESIRKLGFSRVILSRTDNVFLTEITDIETNDGEILSSNFMYDPLFDGFSSICDFFSIGKLDDVVKFASVGLNYKRIYEEGVTFHAETLLSENAKRVGIKAIPKFTFRAHHALYKQL